MAGEIAGKTAVDEQILSIVKKIRSEGEAANRSYEREVDRIERRASYTTIYVSQMNTAIDIIADSKRAMSELYTTYEALVRTLDMQCRPLADQGASAYAVHEVYKLISYMNSESSSLQGNFTASLNSYSLGDVGTIRYMASLEAQTIERFWKTKYSMMPEAIEEEKRRKKAAAEAAKRREEQRKKEAAERAERERLAAEEAKRIEQANMKAKAHMETVSSACMAEVADFEKALQKEMKSRKAALKVEIANKISQLEAQRKQHQEQLAGLGFFKMSEKKSEKQEIARLDNRILVFKDPSLVTKATQEWEATIENAVEAYREKVQDYIAKRFPKNSKKDGIKYPEDAKYADKACPAPPDVKSVFK